MVIHSSNLIDLQELDAEPRACYPRSVAEKDRSAMFEICRAGEEKQPFRSSTCEAAVHNILAYSHKTRVAPNSVAFSHPVFAACRPIFVGIK
jgi:hypothetical protein